MFLLVFTNLVFAQEKPKFWEDIQHFKQLDQDKAPEKNAVLLLGSSSFTNWKDVSDYFPGKMMINRGFGGSTLLDLNLYSKDLLEPYEPSKIFIYCGENDIADFAKPKTVLNRFKNFYLEIRKYHPDVPVYYISMKLSPSRENFWPEMIKANRLISRYISKQKNAAFIDITKPMEKNGRVREELFLEDRLHMKPEGYRIWTEVLEPYMK